MGKEVTDITIFLQGPLHTTGINTISEYSSYGEVILVYYENDPRLDLLNREFPPNVKTVKIQCPRTNEHFNFNNTYLQTYGVLKSLENVNTEFSIRTRTDESFPHMEIFIKNIKDNPEKFHVTNLYSFKDKEHKFCMGNHIFAGKTKYLLNGFKWGLEACKITEMSKYGCGMLDGSKMYLTDIDGVRIPMWSEIYNTICMLKGKEIEIQAKNSRAIMLNNFILTPLSDFPNFAWTHKYSNHEPIKQDLWNSKVHSNFLDSIDDI